MKAFYDLVTGPLAWASCLICLGGIIFRLYRAYVSARDNDPMVLDYFNLRYALRSIVRWSTPFATYSMRQEPVMTFFFFLFHVCAIISPLFLSGHILLLEENFGISWITIPDKAADIMTVLALVACLYFLWRRIAKPEVKYLTTPGDFIVLAITAAPFLTGFLAYHQIFAYDLMISLHIFSGEILLLAIPFTKLSHMIFAPLTRAYIGSEFGAIRHARDW